MDNAQKSRDGCHNSAGTVTAANRQRTLTPARRIIEEEAWKAGVAVSDVLGRRRLMDYVRPRHRAMLRIRRELGYSYPRIGRIFGRHHVSVLTCVRKQEDAEARRRKLQARTPRPVMDSLSG